MEKVLAKLKRIVIVLVIVMLSLVAFFGTFKKNKGIWSNIIPEYKYGMDLEGIKELRYSINNAEEEKYVYVDENGNIVDEVWKDGTAQTAETENSSESENEANQDTEKSEEVNEVEEIDEAVFGFSKETRKIKVNSDESLTKSNFEKTKKIIIDRLKLQDVENYNIRLDDVTGNMVIEVTNNDDDIYKVENIVNQVGKFRIVDYQNGLTLMDNSDIKNVSALYSSEDLQIFLQFEFNKEGAQKLKEISNKYVETAGETEGSESTKKYVTILLDDTKMLTTYFGEEMSNGILQISVGQGKTGEEAYENLQNAKIIADVLNTGIMPVTYELQSDNFVKSSVTSGMKTVALVIFAIVIVIVSILFIIKYKLNGLFASILGIGFIAIYSLVSKYTNVLITLNSLIAYAVIIGLNYLLTYNILANLNEENGFWKTLKKFIIDTITIDVITVVFIFTKYTVINSVGMVTFWGMILIALYNILFARAILKK